MPAVGVLTVGFEQTGLELDDTGTARAVRRLGAALQDAPGIELVPLAQPNGAAEGPVRGASRRIARGLRRELAWLPSGCPGGPPAWGSTCCTAPPPSRPCARACRS